MTGGQMLSESATLVTVTTSQWPLTV